MVHADSNMDALLLKHEMFELRKFLRDTTEDVNYQELEYPTFNAVCKEIK